MGIGGPGHRAGLRSEIPGLRTEEEVRMGLTIAEKILARAGGKNVVKAGDEIMARPDFIHSYDFPGYTDAFFREMREEFGLTSPPAPERFALFIDHMVPPHTPKEEDLHLITRRWAKEQKIPLFERFGIGHQVATEVGYAVPGAFLVHFDGHVSQLGAFGMLALGLRRNILEAYVRERISLQVPSTTKVVLTGRLPHGVMARDVFHHILRQLGPSFCRFQVLELDGPAVAAMSMGERQTLCGLAMFTGASTAIINPDERCLTQAGDCGPRVKLSPVRSDPDARYAAVHQLDLSSIEPLLAAPPHPANIKPLAEVVGLEVHVGYIGSCVSGRMEDLQVAARILKEHKVKEGFQLNIIPTSRRIMAEAAKAGLWDTLLESGAFVSSPSCDYCFGHIATMSAGQRAISTGTLNVPGRMGSPDSEIFLGSAAAVAAAAVEGRIVDPRSYL
jgi:3-isopropylmalate/(R)-2-methylmalate dehydratase large subunit